jgi:DNA-binding response OmpR family regulator
LQPQDFVMARIIVVDDSEEVGEIMTSMLMRGGHEVTWTDGGSATRSIMMQQHFDLAVIDIVLVGESGTNLRDFALARGSKVLLTSGYPDYVSEPPQGSAFISKPFRVAQLLAAVDALLADDAAPPMQAVRARRAGPR